MRATARHRRFPAALVALCTAAAAAAITLPTAQASPPAGQPGASAVQTGAPTGPAARSGAAVGGVGRSVWDGPIGTIPRPTAGTSANPTNPTVPAGTAVGGQECDAVQTAWAAEARPQAEPEPELNGYSDSGEGWTGGDSTYSVKLSGGRTVWVFSDTFLGPVNPDGSRPLTTPFVNQSFVVQRGDSLETVTGGTPTNPTSLVPPPTNGWYWFGAATTSNAGRNLDIATLKFERTGPGQWDWRWVSNHLARFDIKTLKLQKLLPLPSTANVQWSAWQLRDSGYTYVYGVEDLGLSKYQHVARVKGDDLAAGGWQYWTGTGWSADENASTRILEGVANEHSVTRWKDGYLLVTHDTRELFSKKVVGYFACSPTGPFVNPVELYQTPETGADGTYRDADIITYNSHEHPDRRRGNDLLVSYNVNSLDPNNDLYADVSIYRPRFTRITLTPKEDTR